MREIKISAECGVVMNAELNDSKTAEALWNALPIESVAQRWGDEVYFDISLRAEEEDPQAKVPPGAIAYWPPGTSFCIFFGQTPYSPVNVLGKLLGEAKDFAKVRPGEAIKLERLEPK